MATPTARNTFTTSAVAMWTRLVHYSVLVCVCLDKNIRLSIYNGTTEETKTTENDFVTHTHTHTKHSGKRKTPQDRNTYTHIHTHTYGSSSPIQNNG